MDVPATGALTGTPASISDNEVPQTDAIEEEPFDSVISETTRMVYGKASMVGHRSTAALGEAAVTDLAFRAHHAASLTHRVVVMERKCSFLYSSDDGVDELAVTRGAEGHGNNRLGFATGGTAERSRARAAARRPWS